MQAWHASSDDNRFKCCKKKIKTTQCCMINQGETMFIRQPEEGALWSSAATLNGFVQVFYSLWQNKQFVFYFTKNLSSVPCNTVHVDFFLSIFVKPYKT